MSQGMAEESDEILVVDDDPGGREALGLFLGEAGYRVRLAASGTECLSEVERALPSLVLLDVSMPGLDGIETLRRLRSRYSGLPVILLTGARSDPESIGAGLVVGAEEYLIKPIRPRELMARVQALLELGRARRMTETLRIEQMAMLVHDLRQPLVAVTLRGEMLAEEASDPEVRRMGEAIRSACQQMSYLVSAVLTLARRTATGQELERRRCPVEPIVADVVAQLEPIADKRGISIRVDASGHTLADVDEFRLIQVLHNLLGNALKFTPRGGRIEVTCRRCETHLELGVSDTGPGLRPEEAERIFERWVQTEVGQAHGGSGLGLAIAREIVEAHGGRIHCETRPGEGARFWFTLPLAASARAVESPPSP